MATFTIPNDTQEATGEVQMQARRPKPKFTVANDDPNAAPATGGLSNILEQIPAGATAAAVEVGETIKEAGDFIRDRFQPLKKLILVRNSPSPSQNLKNQKARWQGWSKGPRNS